MSSSVTYCLCAWPAYGACITANFWVNFSVQIRSNLSMQNEASFILETFEFYAWLVSLFSFCFLEAPFMLCCLHLSPVIHSFISKQLSVCPLLIFELHAIFWALCSSDSYSVPSNHCLNFGMKLSAFISSSNCVNLC